VVFHLKINFLLSSSFNDGRAGLSVQDDMRWDRHSSGHAYNSDSGASIMVGNHSSRVFLLECMSKRCHQCKLGLDHKTIFCPKNYDGSSEGKEAVGALRNVRKIWEHGDCYAGTYVMDDDSTTCSVRYSVIITKKCFILVW
jgi:hypothetical protein